MKSGSSKKLKVYFVDIETAPNLAYVWEKYEQDVIAFKEERYLMAIAWKLQGEKEVHSLSLKTVSRKQLVKKLWLIFDDADILIAHNGDQFDIKMANAFFIKFGLKPPSPYKTIDTKKVAKFLFRFNSNKLDDLGNYLGLGRKERTGGIVLWLDCIQGISKAWDKMMSYNRKDIILLEKVYDRLKIWTKTDNPLIWTSNGTCQSCGGHSFERNGYTYTATSKREKMKCKNCGKYRSGVVIKLK